MCKRLIACGELAQSDIIQEKEASDDSCVLVNPPKWEPPFELYCGVKGDFSLTDAHKKKRRKDKKKKEKKDKKPNNDRTPYYPLHDAFFQFVGQPFCEEYSKWQSQNIPASLILKYPDNPGFFCGTTSTGEFAGKPMDEDGHIAVFGGSGSGKTTGIAIPTFFTWNGSIFSFDFKGDLIKCSIKRRAKILCLIEGQNKRYWYNPFYILERDGKEKLPQNARALAYAIIPPPFGDQNPFWINATRGILTGAIVYYFNLGRGFIDTMIEIKTTPMAELLEKIKIDATAKVCVCLDAISTPKTLASISILLHDYISVFATDTQIQDAFLPSADQAMLAWEDLDTCDIFIRMDQSRIDEWRSVMRLMLVQLIRTLQKRPEKYEPAGKCIPPTLLLLDEFPQYGKVDEITSALKVLRSKNVTFALFCQSLADLDETYGEATRSAILDNCLYKAILNASDGKTQKYFSDLIGTVKVPSKGIGANVDEQGCPTGYSFSINETRESIIHPHEFASLQDVILLHPGPERFCRLEKETWFIENTPLIEERR